MSLNVKPNNTTVAFDIHGVLFKPNYKQIAGIIIQSKQIIKLFFIVLNPFLLCDLLKLVHQRTIPEACIMKLAIKYPRIKQFIPLFTRIANAQKPIPATIEILEKLKTKGYNLHILSNIGEQFFNDLAQTFPQIFNYFDKVKVPSASDDYIQKPNPLIFQNYVTDYNQNVDQIFFIDNNKRNIQVASSLGIIGIHFTNPTALYNALYNLRIL